MASYIWDLNNIVGVDMDISFLYPFLALTKCLNEYMARKHLRMRLALQNDNYNYVDALYEIFLLGTEYKYPELIWLSSKQEKESFKRLLNDDINKLDTKAICLSIINSKNDSMVDLMLTGMAYSLEFRIVGEALVRNDYVLPLYYISNSKNIKFKQTFDVFDTISLLVVQMKLPSFKLIEFLINEGYNGDIEYYNMLYSVAFAYREMEGFSKLRLDISIEYIVDNFISIVLETKLTTFFDAFNILDVTEYINRLTERQDLSWLINYIEQRKLSL